MTDRILDMQAKLSGASQAERELTALERSAKKVEQAAGGAATSEKSLAAALAARSESASKALESTEKTFSVTDRLSSIVGKVTGVIGLATIAVTAATGAWNYFTDAEAKAERQTALMNAALDGQISRLKRTQAELKGVQEAAAGLAGRAGLLEANLTATERREAQGRELDRVAIKEKLVEVLRKESEAELAVARARAAGGVSMRQGELDELSAERERLAVQLETLDLKDKALEATARRREGLDTQAPKAPGGGGGGGGVNAAFDRALVSSLPGAGLQDVAGSAAPDQVDSGNPYSWTERAIDGLTRLGEVARETFEREKALFEARREGTKIALGYAEASAKAGAAQALSAVLRGESVTAAVNAVLQGVAVEATVEAAFETAKGIAASANPLTAPAAAAHFAAAKAFAATAALAGLGAAATGGFGGGGGGGGSSPAQVEAPRGPGAFGRERDEEAGGGLTIINNMDLRTRPLTTNRELQREWARNMNDYARLPGRQRVARGLLGGRGGGY